MALPIYFTGTVSVAAGGTVVTLTGGMWSGINAKQGDFISIDNSDGILITEVTDSTHLKIPPWQGAAKTNVTYTIYQNYVGRVVGVAAAEDVGDMLEKLHVDGLPFILGEDETVPDPSYGDEGQLALKPTTGQWWVKSGGAWVVSTGLTALGYGGTSTTSLAIGFSPPPKVFTTQGSLAYNGARVRAASAANLNNWMEGVVGYSGTTLTMTADKISGSGTHADWLFSIAGHPGVDGTGTGDVVGPASAVTDRIAAFNGPTGKIIKDGGKLISELQLANQAVRYDAAQTLTAAQQKQARANVGVNDGNIIVNGDFRVNQGGYVSAAALAAGTYGHDQWKAGASGGDYSFTQLKSSTQITIASGKSLIQPIEDANVAGGSYVLTWTGTAQARAGVNTLTPSGAYATSPLLISGQTAGTVMSVEFNSGTLGTVKLEIGATATPFVMRPYDQELRTCQRYFAVLSSATANFKQFGSGLVLSTTNSLAVVYFPTRLRGVPAITFSSPAHFGATAMVADVIDEETARINLTVAGTRAQDGYIMQANNTLAARINIDARL